MKLLRLILYLAALFATLASAGCGASTQAPATAIPATAAPSPQPAAATPVPTQAITVAAPTPPGTAAAVPSANAQPIFVGTIAHGFDMGVDTSERLYDWVTVDSGVMCMSYPDGQDWGAVFITVGPPVDPPYPSKDLSGYTKLSLELKGQAGGESVQIGLKDDTDPNNGSEKKYPVRDLPTEWKPIEIPLSYFTTATLQKLYVVTEFVFAGKAETVCTRNIQFQ